MMYIETFVDDGEFTELQATQAYNIAETVGINILSDKELFEIDDDELGNVNGASFISIDHEEIWLDVVISPESQGQGIGKRLVDSIIQYCYDTPVKSILAECVNPVMTQLLSEHFGFKVMENCTGNGSYCKIMYLSL